MTIRMLDFYKSDNGGGCVSLNMDCGDWFVCVTDDDDGSTIPHIGQERIALGLYHRVNDEDIPVELFHFDATWTRERIQMLATLIVRGAHATHADAAAEGSSI